MELTDKRVVSTPEGVPIELVLAGLGSRFAAIFIDTMIQIILIAILFFIYVVSKAESVIGQNSTLSYILTFFYIVINFIIYFGYFIIFEMLTGGRSPGKLMAKIKVVDINGKGLTFRASLIRNLVRIIDYLPSYYILGALFIFFSSNDQRIGDLAARTVVVQYEFNSSGKLTDWNRLSWINAGGLDQQYNMANLFTNTARFIVPPELAHLDTTKLTYNDTVVIQNFLVRRHQLAPDIREKMGVNLANAIATKIGGYNNDWPPEVFLETVTMLKNLK